MRGVGPFTPREKTFMIIMSSVIVVAAVVSLIIQIISGGDGWWLETVLVIAAGIWGIFIIRRSPTIDKRPGFGLFRNRRH
jgi:predicted membrane channel-forming protein YqfA (hemolysin III family)